MLVNNLHNDPDLKESVTTLLGKPFTLQDRLKISGAISPKITITDSSLQIRNLLVLDTHTKTCTITLRPKGILLNFQVQLQSYHLVIPFYKLKVYKGRAEEYSIYMDHHFIKIKAPKEAMNIHNYFKKLIALKADSHPKTIDDLY
ncbi:hypothetical protein [Aquimarina brevivitae]|uniref:PH (Pleckstrin Homology) domain-containing protein n=1 Tax=Aquimarina brevivitae TaxID=323412 RepID=A0A4Q7PHU3_9FLAO|nr:hypothetical protein [Aquimarina brevivitae]RZS99985.1 hypothetical protein EV197_1216 [Aquimarina brevivitae]